MTFEDLKFKLDYPDMGDFVQAKVFFENGYGASVISNNSRFISLDGLYELAVLKGNEDSWDLCYDTEITSDVIPYKSPEEVTELLQRIEAL